MNYRIAEVEDFERLAELRWEFRAEGGEVPLLDKSEFISRCVAFFESASKSGFHTFWVAETDGEIIGNLFVHRVDLIPRPCRVEDAFGYVTNNYVVPSYRGRGTGRALIEKVREWAENEDLELLIVYPSERAESLYKSLGFTPDNDVLELRLREY